MYQTSGPDIKAGKVEKERHKREKIKISRTW
jgi:hypothetical protein